jgi:hypothetical protein
VARDTDHHCTQLVSRFLINLFPHLLGKLLPFHFELSLGENKITMVTTAPLLSIFKFMLSCSPMLLCLAFKLSLEVTPRSGEFLYHLRSPSRIKMNNSEIGN